MSPIPSTEHPSLFKNPPVPGGDKKTEREDGRGGGSWNTGIAAPYVDYPPPALPPRCLTGAGCCRSY